MTDYENLCRLQFIIAWYSHNGDLNVPPAVPHILAANQKWIKANPGKAAVRRVETRQQRELSGRDHYYR